MCPHKLNVEDTWPPSPLNRINMRESPTTQNTHVSFTLYLKGRFGVVLYSLSHFLHKDSEKYYKNRFYLCGL